MILSISAHKGGGSSAYYPKMLLKVIVYRYTQRIYSGRVIAKNLRENIYFMWISAKNTPNFRTINNFRSKHLKNEIDKALKNEEEYQDNDLEGVEAEFITPEKLKEVAKKIDESLAKEELPKDQFILNYTIHQKPGDTTTLISHLNVMRERIGVIPVNIVADAGYGSLENY